jgi:hypothetical protein
LISTLLKSELDFRNHVRKACKIQIQGCSPGNSGVPGVFSRDENIVVAIYLENTVLAMFLKA